MYIQPPMYKELNLGRPFDKTFSNTLTVVKDDTIVGGIENDTKAGAFRYPVSPLLSYCPLLQCAGLNLFSPTLQGG
jgi:hypothetical protein